MLLDSFKYSIPYVVLVLYYIVLFFIEHFTKKDGPHSVVNRQIIIAAAVLGILFFFGLRGLIGWDWTIYYPAFKSIPPLFSLNAAAFSVTRYEPGFVIYISLIKLIWSNYSFFIFICTLIDLVILIAIIKQFSRFSYALSCLVFIVMGGFYLETDLLRNAKSIMLFLLSLKYLKERRIVPFYILNILGCLFHFSSLFYLPLYFFLHKTIPKKVVIAIFIAGLIIFLLKVEYILPLITKVAKTLGETATESLQKYLKDPLYSSGYGLTIGLAERVMTAILIIIYYDKLIEQNRDNILFINSFVLFFIFFFFFAEIKIIPIRVGGLFYPSYWILYPALYKVIVNKNNRAIFLAFIFVYALVKVAGMTDTILYRYDNTLFGAESFDSRMEIFQSTSGYFLK
jgi:hypothetical protein